MPKKIPQTPQELWRYVQEDKSRFNKINTLGKKTYLQYGYDNKFLTEQDLTEESINRTYVNPIKSQIKLQPIAQPQLPLNKHDRQKKAVAQQGKIAPKNLVRPENPFAPYLVPFTNQLTFGALDRNTDVIEKLSEKHPVASTIGNIAGYGAKFAMLGGANSALSTPLTKGIANPIVKRIAGEAITGMGIDAVEEAVKGKNDIKQAGKNVAMGAVYGILADTAMEGAGRLIKSILKKYGKNIPEQVAQTIAKVQDIEAKPEKTNADVEEYYAMIDYLDEVNRKSPDYIKAEARLNVPKAKEIKTLTKTINPQVPNADEYMDAIGWAEEQWKNTPAYLRAEGKLPRPKGFTSPTRQVPSEYMNEYMDTMAGYEGMYPTPTIPSLTQADLTTRPAKFRTNKAINIEPLNKRIEPPILKTEAKLQPPTIKGQTLKPNKPILSALDAKVNKPYVEPIRPTLDLPKTSVEPPKVSGGINTPPIENKSLTGALKASDETLPKRKFGDTPKGDILEGMKERGFSKNIRTDTAMPDDIRIDFDDSPLAYKQVGNPETLSKAENIMKNGQSQAMSEYYDLLGKNKPEAIPLAKLIAKEAEAAGDIKAARRVLADAAEKLTEAGQFSQAAKILREADPETFLMTVDKQIRKLNEQGLKQYGKKWANIDLLPDEITAIKNIPRGNQQVYEEVWEKIGERIAKELPSSGMEKFDAWRRMAMLLNPKTHIRNTLGNVFMVGMRKTSDTIGAGLEKLFTIKDRTKSFGWSRNKELVSKVDDIWNSVKGNVLGESRWEIDNLKALGREKNIFKNKKLQALNEFSLKTLNAEDNIFTQRAFKDALGQFMQANGLKEANEKAIEYATRRAWESTYKQANKLADWINQAKKTPVVGRLVEAAIPFTKTPANIMKTTFEYSPAGLIKLIFSKGKPPVEVIETLAKGLTGTSITGLGFWLASMGYAKTQNSKSAKKTAIDTEMGEQPYSITTPQGSYTFDWAQPIAVPFAMGIAMYESIEDKENIDLDAITDSIAQGGDSLFNMSMLQNIKQFLGYSSTTENILGLPWEYVQQAFPSIFGQVAKTIDTTRRSTYDPNEKVKTLKRLQSRIPIASKSLEPALNVWGKEQKQGGAIQQFINPGYVRPASNDKVTKEVDRLHSITGDNNILPKMAQNFTYQGKQVKLTPKQMTEFQRNMGKKNYTDINGLISSQMYRPLSDEEKAKRIKKIVDKNYEVEKQRIIKELK